MPLHKRNRNRDIAMDNNFGSIDCLSFPEDEFGRYKKVDFTIKQPLSVIVVGSSSFDINANRHSLASNSSG